MKIVTVIGARPQFIKAAAVSRAIRMHNESESNTEICEIIVHTGQHFDANMSDVFFEQLDIPRPNYNLGISGVSHGAMTGRMLEQIESLLQEENPDWVLVYGDTNSTLAAALAASKLHIPIAHVEAGLRSNNMAMPEEVNRIITDRVSTLLLCPTQAAANNLESEGYPFPSINNCKQRIENVGDVMFDATLFYKDRVNKTIDLRQWGLIEKEYVLCTLHRAENTDDASRLSSIFSALIEISNKCKVVLPLHPRTRNKLTELDLLDANSESGNDNMKIIAPLSYFEMQRLEMGAVTILTDSGGVQKEAFFHQVPCLTLRDETEWMETLEFGWNQLVGADKQAIVNGMDSSAKPEHGNFEYYGSGNASQKIVALLVAS